MIGSRSRALRSRDARAIGGTEMARAAYHTAFGFLAAALVGACSVKEGDEDTQAGAGGESAEGTGGLAGSGGGVSVSGGGGGGAGGSAGVGAALDVEDPAPEATEPGESRSCDAGPDSDLSVFVYTDVTATS